MSEGGLLTPWAMDRQSGASAAGSPSSIVSPTSFIPDEHQERVIAWRAGEAICAAAAGSGKTATLIERTARLINEGVLPAKLLTLTYNTDAAQVFRDRLSTRLPAHLALQTQVSTFHAWCYRLLRAWYPQAVMLRTILGGDGAGSNPAKPVYVAMDKARVSFWKKDWRAWVGLADFLRDRALDWAVGSDAAGFLVDGADRAADDASEHHGAFAIYKLATKRWGFDEDQTTELLRFLHAYEAIKREGQFASVDFADMPFLVVRAIRIWEAEGRPLQHPVAHLRSLYDHVQVDEGQDGTPARWTIALHLGLAARSLLTVGDARQCQPAGTMVDTPSGTVPIESLRDGDRVNAWERKSQHVSTSEGYSVRVGCRPYTGWLFSIETAQGTTRCTDTHRWLTRWSEDACDFSAVYLMYRADRGFRMGWCKVIDESQGKKARHYVARARLEKADAIWLVKVTTSRGEASEWESCLSTEYQLPLIMFESKSVEGEHYTQDRLDRMWQRLGALSQAGALRLLHDYGLSIDRPIWRNGDSIMREKTRATLFEAAACNLVTGMMVPVPVGRDGYGGTRTFEWRVIQRVRAEWVTDLPVYSLDVEERHSYIADGLCTLNSLYSWQAADPSRLQERLSAGATLLVLPVNRRSTRRIVEQGNSIARGYDWHLGGDCAAMPTAAEGAPVYFKTDLLDEWEEATWVADEIEKRVRADCADRQAPSSFAILSRTNNGLVPFETALMARKVPVRVLGREGGIWSTGPGRQVYTFLKLAAGDPWGDIEAVEIMNTPLRYCRKVDVIEWLRWVRSGAGGLQRGERDVEKLLHRVPTTLTHQGLQRFLLDLRSLARLSWEARCRQTGSYLIIDDQRERGEATDAPANPLADLADDDDDVRKVTKMIVRAAIDAKSLDGIEAQIREAKKEKPDVVELSTVHRYKGRERPTVFVTGVRSGMLPHEKSDDLEEERRIYYVACTRAKNELIVTTGGEPSEFLVADDGEGERGQ